MSPSITLTMGTPYDAIMVCLRRQASSATGCSAGETRCVRPARVV